MSLSKNLNSSNFEGRRFNDGYTSLSTGGVSSDISVNLIFKLSPGRICLQCHHLSNVFAVKSHRPIAATAPIEGI